MWLYPYTPVSIVMCPSYSFSDYSTLSLFYQTAAFNFDKANTISHSLSSFRGTISTKGSRGEWEKGRGAKEEAVALLIKNKENLLRSICRLPQY